MGGRIDIETDDVADLGGELRQQALDAFVHEPRLPAPDGGLADPRRRPHDIHYAHAIGRGQHDPGAPNMLLRAVTVINDRRLRSVGLRWTTTPARIPQTLTTPRGILTRTLLARSIH